MALKQYALGQGLSVKVHDLLTEAMEEWADKRGVSTTFRFPTDRKRRQRLAYGPRPNIRFASARSRQILSMIVYSSHRPGLKRGSTHESV